MMEEDTFDPKFVFETVKFEYRELFWKKLGPDSWSFSYSSSCDFCQEPTRYHSDFMELKSCENCLGSLWNSELDSLTPTLNRFFRTWIDQHFNLQMNNPSKQHTCYVCHKNIEHKSSICGYEIRYVKINDKFVTAHEGCIFNKHIGFTNFFTEEEYQFIIETYIQPQLLKSLNEINLKQGNPRLVSSPFDLIKINSLLDSTDESFSDNYIDYITVSNWIPFQDGQCSFCNDLEVIKKNEHYNLLGCKSCIQELIDEEVDVDNPQDHPLSQKIHEILCDFIQKNYFLIVESDIIFNEYFIEHNICYSCGNQIENCDVAVFINGNAIAHHDCVSETGFIGLLTDNDFKGIISDNFEGIYY